MSATLFGTLEVGKRYRGRGPNEGKMAPPPEVEIVEVNAKGYATKGTRQVAPIILFGCEGFWEEVPDG